MHLIGDAAGDALRQIFGGGAYLWQIVALTLRVSAAGLLIGTIVGMPVGIATAVGRFRGRGLAIALIHTGFALPPVVVGLFVYLLLSRSGPLGGLGLLFTPAAMVIAQAILAAPYVAGISLAAVQAVPRDLWLQARALGASPPRALATHLREARFGLLSAVVAGFGAVTSEVGAVLMVGGNIEGETRVMTTAIVLETRRGNFGPAVALGVLLLLIAFVANVLFTRAQHDRHAALAPERPWL